MIIKSPCLDCYDLNKGLWSKGSEYPQVKFKKMPLEFCSVEMVMPLMLSVTLILFRMFGNTRACHSMSPSVVTTPW